MKRPSKAIILAAGLGERMRPLSAHMPKAMLPFCGAPIIERTISLLCDWGVKDILINLHHAPSPLVDYIRTALFPGVRLSFSFEPEIRGTGGALRQAEWFIGRDPFWIVNSDIVFELNPVPLCHEFERRKALACLWVTQSAGPRTVHSLDGKITSFSTQQPGGANTATFCGVHLVSPAVMKYIPEDTFSSIIASYQKAMADGKRICSVEVAGSYWADIGSPEKLIACHKELESRSSRKSALSSIVRSHHRMTRQILSGQGVQTYGFVSAGRNVNVARSSSLENCILGNNIKVGPNSRLTNCIVADNQSVKGQLRRAIVPIKSAFAVEDLASLRSRGWLASDAYVEALPPRGSDRSFFRLHDAKRPAILIKYDSNNRPENQRFAQNLSFMDSLGIPVPGLFLDLPSRSICIVEDLGDTSLQHAYPKLRPHERRELYMRLMRFTAVLHSKGADLAKKRSLALEEPFNAELYKWEHELFAGHYLSGIRNLDSKTIRAILKEIRTIPGRLSEKKVLIHRDLQSSNVMLKAGRPVFIDFQGLRLGSRYYDLASLLFDPYVCLPKATRSLLLQEYSALSGLEDRKVFQMTHIAGIQRLAQALGAFGRLSKLEGMAHFADFIAPACSLMKECIAETGGMPLLDSVIVG